MMRAHVVIVTLVVSSLIDFVDSNNGKSSWLSGSRCSMEISIASD